MNNNAETVSGIALALSGGGIRAAVFHLGALLRLAKSGHLEAVTQLSTVSGGSLTGGLVLSAGGYRWPSSSSYIDSVLPAIRSLTTTRDLQMSMICRALSKPWRLFYGRGAALADAIEATWGIKESLSDLPESPVWFINATNYYTGKNWRFSRHRMGDWRSGYVDFPKVKLAVALAASAGVPYVVGGTRVRLPTEGWYSQFPGTNERNPMSGPAEKAIWLWDGGVYENLGVEALYKVGNGFVYPNTKFLLVCDAGQRLLEGSTNVKGPIYFDGVLPHLSLNVRSVDIMMDQNRALRSRLVVSEIQSDRIMGSYVRIGNTAAQIAEAASKKIGRPISYGREKVPAALADRLAKYPTVLSRLSEETFDQLVAHGYEATDATLASYHAPKFGFVPFGAA